MRIVAMPMAARVPGVPARQCMSDCIQFPNLGRVAGPPKRDSMVPRMQRATAVDPPAPVRPFLKWAGGKRQLLRELRRFVPPAFRGYHEPFLGSGALFFDL